MIRWMVIGVLANIGVANTGIEAPIIERYGVWDQSPAIVVCADFPGSVNDVQAAVNEIKIRTGHPIRDAEAGTCFERPEGAIQITGPNMLLSPQMVGLTVPLGPSDSPLITGAMIVMRPGYGGSPVMVHELLHALGLNHARMDGHVMTPNATRAGPSWDGVADALGGGMPTGG